MTHTQSTTQRFYAEIRACLALAIPLVGAQLAQSATSFIDTVMMGWLGSETIAAGGLAANLFAALVLTAAAIASAVSPLTAQAYGANHVPGVSQPVRQGLWLALLLGLPITLLLWNGEGVLRNLGQTPTTAAMGGTYLRAIAPGLLPALGFAALRSFVAALSQTRPILVIITVGTLCNTLGNYLLMFGKLGLPALGLAGIGYSSSLSLWGMFLAMGAYVACRPEFKPYSVFRQIQRFQPAVFRELLRIGVPIGVMALAETGLFTVTTLLMGRLGTAALAAHQIALQFAVITYMVPLGISMATTVRVGQLIGQGDRPAAQRAGFVGIGLGATFMCSMGALIWLVPEWIVSLFIDVNAPENAEVVLLAESLLAIAALFQIADGVQVCAAGALRGIKDTLVPMLIGLVAYWGIGLISGYGLAFLLGLGAPGLWWGLAIALLAASSILTWRFARFHPPPSGDAHKGSV